MRLGYLLAPPGATLLRRKSMSSQKVKNDSEFSPLQLHACSDVALCQWSDVTFGSCRKWTHNFVKFRRSPRRMSTSQAQMSIFRGHPSFVRALKRDANFCWEFTLNKALQCIEKTRSRIWGHSVYGGHLNLPICSLQNCSICAIYMTLKRPYKTSTIGIQLNHGSTEFYSAISYIFWTNKFRHVVTHEMDSQRIPLKCYAQDWGFKIWRIKLFWVFTTVCCGNQIWNYSKGDDGSMINWSGSCSSEYSCICIKWALFRTEIINLKFVSIEADVKIRDYARILVPITPQITSSLPLR